MNKIKRLCILAVILRYFIAFNSVINPVLIQVVLNFLKLTNVVHLDNSDAIIMIKVLFFVINISKAYDETPHRDNSSQKFSDR